MGNRELRSIIIQREKVISDEQFSGILKSDAQIKIEKILENPQANILNDQPVVEDALGMKSLVKTLSEIILSENTQTPITISINGKWGTGKTSILRMIEKNAKLLSVPCIWLNAWSLDTTESLITSTASEIQEHTTRKADTNTAIENTLGKFLKAAVSTFEVSQGLIGFFNDALARIVENTITKINIDRIDKEQKREIKELASVVTARRTFGDLIQLLLRESNTKADRVIVFIDDIDRALPDQIANLLKNLKLILEVPNCVFVLGMDQDIVAKAIEAHYFNKSSSSTISLEGTTFQLAGSSSVSLSQSENSNGVDGFGYKYLDKLVQLVVDVPILSRETCLRYLDNLNIHPDIIEIVEWAPNEDVLNPRSLKRYINWLSMSLQLIVSIGMPKTISNIEALRFIALRRDYPEIYDYFINKKEKKFRLSPNMNTWLESYLGFDYSTIIKDVSIFIADSTLEYFEENHKEFYDFSLKSTPRKNYSDVRESKLKVLFDPKKILKLANEFVVHTENILPFVSDKRLRKNLFLLSYLQKYRNLETVDVNNFLRFVDRSTENISEFQNIVDLNPLLMSNYK